ncbi:hypothetical protein [Desulfovibrio fairfieldensis]|uniref:Uncharacterized protein n=1 Tax=Desulfovibrio fairfieldensis TaxID=44742 RepID=A0A0X8JK87_9BACT|nr:hypothetical protein [Desulfovibrio fairfieldensis]AMD90132.1 hypothetical protein AXF13_08345 [Desulfovibrio fairfieldensis]
MNVVITRLIQDGKQIEVGFYDAMEDWGWAARIDGKKISLRHKNIVTLDQFAEGYSSDQQGKIEAMREAGVTHMLGDKIALYRGELDQLETARAAAKTSYSKVVASHIAEGEYFKVLHLNDSKVEICVARYLTSLEKEQFHSDYQDVMLFPIPGTNCELQYVGWRDLPAILGYRAPTHTMPGCNYRIWLISDDEEREAIAIEERRAVAMSAKPEELIINPDYAHMSAQQLSAAAREYDLVNNEGAEGFNPYRDRRYIPNPAVEAWKQATRVIFKPQNGDDEASLKKGDMEPSPSGNVTKTPSPRNRRR